MIAAIDLQLADSTKLYVDPLYLERCIKAGDAQVFINSVLLEFEKLSTVLSPKDYALCQSNAQILIEYLKASAGTEQSLYRFLLHKAHDQGLFRWYILIALQAQINPQLLIRQISKIYASQFMLNYWDKIQVTTIN